MLRRILAPLLLVATCGAAQAQAKACGGEFSAWLDGVKAEAVAQSVGPGGIEALSRARQDPKVLSRDRAQGVFAQNFVEFSGRMINSYRLKQGSDRLKRDAAIFARAEQEFGVPGPVIASFWALETDFGAVQGDFSTLDALATLAHDCRRPDLFRPQLIALVELIDQGVLPADVKGAWAGEIGQTQILPSDYLDKGRDGDGDGLVDLRRSEPDVIMTTANFLRSLGWRAGEPWVEEVRVPEEMPWEMTGRHNRVPVQQWSAWGVTARDGAPLSAGPDASLVLPMGRTGPAFLVYPNYDVYLEWNKSATYTLTAAHLARRFAGDPAYDIRNPEPGLSIDEMKELQAKLAARGYDVGNIDGVLGSGTREAVRQEQIRLGLAVDGWPTQSLMAAM